MEKRVFGKTDMQVTALGFGGSEIGYEQASLATVQKLLGSALDAGLGVIDTAECYLQSEELIGQAVAGRRNDYYLFTKCGHTDGFANPNWTPSSIEKGFARSLKRLKTEYVDLLQLHSCSEDVLRQGDVIELLQRFKSAGKTRYIGYSGDHRAALYAVECGAFDALQTSVNVADQEAIDLTLPLATKRQMGVIAKRPVANAAWKYATKPSNDYHVPYWERLKVLNFEFQKFDLNKAVEVALRFTLTVPGVHTAIVGTKNPDRWRQNAALVANGPLSKDQCDTTRARWKAVAKETWVGEI